MSLEVSGSLWKVNTWCALQCVVETIQFDYKMVEGSGKAKDWKSWEIRNKIMMQKIIKRKLRMQAKYNQRFEIKNKLTLASGEGSGA